MHLDLSTASFLLFIYIHLYISVFIGMELIIMLMKSLSHIMGASMEDLDQCPVIGDMVFCHFELLLEWLIIIYFTFDRIYIYIYIYFFFIDNCIYFSIMKNLESFDLKYDLV